MSAPRSLTATYLSMVDEIDFLLAHDTSCKGVMRQRLMAVKAWLNEEVGEKPNANILALPEAGKVNFVWNSVNLPPSVGKRQFQAAVVPVLEDYCTGVVEYEGYDQGGGYYNFYFSGMCPVHKRVHDGQAWKWVLKQKKNDDHAGFKCWMDNSFVKLATISQLLPP